MNLSDLKDFVARQFAVGEKMPSLTGITYTYSGFGIYNGNYKEHLNKQVLLLDSNAENIGVAKLFFELLLPLIIFNLGGSDLSNVNFKNILIGTGWINGKRIYPGLTTLEPYYIAAALAISSKYNKIAISLESITKDIEADEIEDKGAFKEGAAKEYFGKRYERNAKNRAQAILHHTLTCMVCGFNFEAKYGERGKNFIEVHHVNPIYMFEGEEQNVNPKTDLVTVCSNCHRMMHRRSDNVLTIAEMKTILKSV